MDENVTKLEIKVDDNKEYEINEIKNSVIYAIKSKADHFPELYYLVN